MKKRRMKFLRIALFPVAVLYGLIVRVRNHLYDIGSKREVEFNLPVICVGNLVAGGAGKTPMVEYLVRKFSSSYRIATLSRGYGRRTRGFRLAESSDDHLTLGDEPFQLYRKFKDKIAVAVGEERALAIPEILFRRPEVDLIILDDAFQHRAVKASVNLLLTDFALPFYEDHILPMGMLREPRPGAKRADFVIVTKCPENLPVEKADHIREKIARYTRHDAAVFFTKIRYDAPVKFSGNNDEPENIVALTGIANPKPFLSHLEAKFNVIDAVSFPDHHKFEANEIARIIEKAEKSGQHVSVVTTEKDYVRLLQFEEQILRSNISFFYVPIVSSFLFGENKFDKMISDAIIAFERKNQ